MRMVHFDWLAKSAKVITVKEAPQDIESALNYIAGEYWWKRTGIAFQNTTKEWIIAYTGTGAGKRFKVVVWMQAPNFEAQYETEVGRQGLQFHVQLFELRAGSMVESMVLTDLIPFETSTEIATWVQST